MSNETELAEILQIAQEGEKKLREMSDRATIIAEKWRIKTQAPAPMSVKIDEIEAVRSLKSWWEAQSE
jgi:hypothetical protein